MYDAANDAGKGDCGKRSVSRARCDGAPAGSDKRGPAGLSGDRNRFMICPIGWSRQMEIQDGEANFRTRGKEASLHF